MRVFFSVGLLRRHEDDRDVASLLPFPDSRRRFEAVESRHLHVEKDDRELVLGDALHGLFTGVCAHHVSSERFEQRL